MRDFHDTWMRQSRRKRASPQDVKKANHGDNSGLQPLLHVDKRAHQTQDAGNWCDVEAKGLRHTGTAAIYEGAAPGNLQTAWGGLLLWFKTA